jgi:hypothetical protein
MDKRIDWLDTQIDAITPSFVPSAIEGTPQQDLYVSVGPIPFDTYFDVKLKLDKEATINIYVRDLLGKMVYSKSLKGYPGENKVTVQNEELLSAANLFVYAIYIDQIPVKSAMLMHQ